jgi:hypothetical protein
MMIDLRVEGGAVGSIEKSKKQCLVIDLTFFFFFFPPTPLPPLWLPCDWPMRGLLMPNVLWGFCRVA